MSSQTELVHFDGSFFVTVTTDLCNRLAIVLHAGNLYTCEPGGIMKRPTTFGGNPMPFAGARSLWSSWFAPDGHLYTTGGLAPGLMVH